MRHGEKTRHRCDSKRYMVRMGDTERCADFEGLPSGLPRRRYSLSPWGSNKTLSRASYANSTCIGPYRDILRSPIRATANRFLLPTSGSTRDSERGRSRARGPARREAHRSRAQRTTLRCAIGPWPWLSQSQGSLAQNLPNVRGGFCTSPSLLSLGGNGREHGAKEREGRDVPLPAVSRGLRLEA